MSYDGAQIIGLLTKIHHMNEEHKDARKLYSERFAPDFSTFNFIEPSELGLSKILAWFLNPLATHGQRGRFLELFLEVLGIEAKDCENAHIKTEWSAQEAGRLDILIDMLNFQLVIENKPWAFDQDGQVRRYLGFLEKNGRPKFALVYLTPNGNDPNINSIKPEEVEVRKNDGQLHCWGYGNEILVWLDKCKAECRADRVSIFIDEFSSFVRKQFKDEEDRTMSDHILSEIMKSDVLLSGAMQVLKLADGLREKLLSDLSEQIQNIIPKKKVGNWINPSKKYGSLNIEYSDNCIYFFKISFMKPNCNNLSLGVYRKVKLDVMPISKEKEYVSLNDNIGIGTNNDFWLWQHMVSPMSSLLRAPADWEKHEGPWIEILNKQLAPKIVEAFHKTKDILVREGVC